MEVKVAPSVLSADFSKLGEEIINIEDSGADMIHVDVMDGHFVPNITLGPVIVSAISKITKLPIEAHLMIENPDRYIENFAKAGAGIINIHAEASKNLKRDIELIRSYSVKPGIALNPATPIKVVEKLLDKVDMILIMSVNPGFAGQQFMPEVLPKITELRRIVDSKKLKLDIAVDGGINPGNAKQVVDAGANVLAAASAIFKSKNYKDVISGFKKLGRK
ncbi:ribulose-phosphate 3-epimerase [Candidatus Margulisiibacteriota bacterium]